MKKKNKPGIMVEVVEAIEYFRKALQTVPNGNAMIKNLLSENEKGCMERLYQLSKGTPAKEVMKLKDSQS